jgi:hypothetical protein
MMSCLKMSEFDFKMKKPTKILLQKLESADYIFLKSLGFHLF